MYLSAVSLPCFVHCVLPKVARKELEGIAQTVPFHQMSDLPVQFDGSRGVLRMILLMTTFGIRRTETINSYWYVVDAINQHPRFEIAYPDDHKKQQSIAAGFAEVSSAGFWCCSGAIDGILMWIHKPSEADCSNIGCSPGKFLCGRKKKFGLNCQADCDVRGQFLDISILYPGSTSDCLAFEGMSLFHRLKQGILAPELCLFGDNA